MAMTQVKLGGFVLENIEAINNNFSDVQLNKADKTEIPTNVSQLTNDSGYQTASQVNSTVTSAVNTAITNLVDGAPETLDTLNELAQALGDDANFSATVAAQIGNKVDKVAGMGLSHNDFTDTDKSKLDSLQNYTLPVAGENLGGIKNGGNVVVGPDGTANVSLPEAGSSAIKMTITSTDSGWTQNGEIADGYWFIALSVASQDQKNPLVVFRQNGARYEQIVAMVYTEGNNIVIGSLDKFDGYVVVI